MMIEKSLLGECDETEQIKRILFYYDERLLKMSFSAFQPRERPSVGQTHPKFHPTSKEQILLGEMAVASCHLKVRMEEV